MGVTVWGSAVATEPSVRKVTGVFSGVERANDNLAGQSSGLGVKVLSGLAKGPRAQHAVNRVLKALVNAPANLAEPEVRKDKANLSFWTEKKGPSSDVRQKQFAMIVHGEPDAAQHVSQGREGALGGDIPEGEPAVPEVLKAMVFVVAIETIDRTLEEEEAWVRGEREDKRKSGPAILAFKTKAKGLGRFSTISM